MSHSWDGLGEIASVAQLTGLDAVKLIGLIVKASNTAWMHKKNCRQFAHHLKLIGNLLEQLKISEMKKYPETREPLEGLEDALRRSYVLVNSCRDRSYLYLLAMGWNIVYQFRKAQDEIDRFLKIIPLITLVDNARVRERLEYIDRDQFEYTFDEEDRHVQDVIMKQESTREAASVLKKTLSCSYPNLRFCDALKTENEKLQLELQHSQEHYDVAQCEVIQRLIGVTQTVGEVDGGSEKELYKKASRKTDPSTNTVEYSYEEDHPKKSSSHAASRSISSVTSQHGEEWRTDLLACCSEPSLCLKTLFFPCGTLAKIATAATNRHMSSAEACNELMAYSLILSCCCYTCCVRRKLRKTLNITGGYIDDFLSHLMCCCCALVQELREVEIRGAYGNEKTKVSPPPSQFMEH
ncbi:protein MID1-COMPLEMENTING ACTIVITY 1 [Raphanus sativus]|uniref:Protein MID1-COMPLEMENTING ACTIVITY 1 n=1 Tax=Raphanus sativus TaxID=3726 RepID=A0A9W3DJF3_RAPSA|nr:protein MID1-COMPLEMENTING ACTIVITY 1 [Raphanus sativus]